MYNLSGKSLDDLHNLALQQFDAGNIDDALTLAQYLFKADPINPRTYRLLGAIYRQHGNYELAMHAYLGGILYDATNPEFYLQMAQVVYLAGYASNALGFVEQGLEFAKNDAHLRAQLTELKEALQKKIN